MSSYCFNWRLLSADVCRNHASTGIARIALGGFMELETHKEFPILNLTKTPLIVGGPYLRPKVVRSWFWEMRKLRAMAKPWSMLVSAYDPVARVSILRIGTVTLPEVVARYVRVQSGRDHQHEPWVL